MLFIFSIEFKVFELGLKFCRWESMVCLEIVEGCSELCLDFWYIKVVRFFWFFYLVEYLFLIIVLGINIEWMVELEFLRYNKILVYFV